MEKITQLKLSYRLTESVTSLLEEELTSTPTDPAKREPRLDFKFVLLIEEACLRFLRNKTNQLDPATPKWCDNVASKLALRLFLQLEGMDLLGENFLYLLPQLEQKIRSVLVRNLFD